MDNRGKKQESLLRGGSTGSSLTPRFTKQAAYHEAAHAVARIYVGSMPTRTEIDEFGGGVSEGTGQIFDTPGGGQYAIWDHLIVTLAGPYAEARVRRQSFFFVLITNGHSDYLQAKRLTRLLVSPPGLSFAFADSEVAVFERAEMETRHFLRVAWPQISKVARVLLRTGFLSAAELSGMVEPGLVRGCSMTKPIPHPDPTRPAARSGGPNQRCLKL